MKIIEPKFEIWEQKEGLEGVYEMIEKVGRTCYASDPIEGKAKDFVDRMIKNGHGAMLEHGTIYLKIPLGIEEINNGILYFYINNKYSKFQNGNEEYGYITTNYRVLVENNRLNDLQYLCDPTEHHAKRVTVNFYTQIAISREFNRHRVDSIGEQSTRYCNYSKDKFEGEITINLPTFVKEVMEKDSDADIEYKELSKDIHKVIKSLELVDEWDWLDWWFFGIRCAEMSYLNMIRLGRTPQEARTVLPLCTNTVLTHTAFISDWKHFFELRALGTTGKPHPDAKALAEPLMETFKKKF